MGLKLNKDLDGGYVANHYYINSIHLIRDGLTAHGDFKLYKSKAARLAGEASVGNVTADVSIAGGDTVIEILNALRAEVRKAGQALEGAEDD